LKTATKAKRKHAARDARAELQRQQRERLQAVDPLSRDNLKKLGLRIGIPALVVWAVALAIGNLIVIGVVAALTVALVVLVVWMLRVATKSRAVASIVQGADTSEGRKEAIDELDRKFKKGDAAASVAKAQLLMQEDPRAALVELETVDLKKTLAPVADEVRSQRAMIHLLLGEIDQARSLADHVDLARHKEHKIRATLAAIVGEAWARTGQARKAAELLENFDPDDADYRDLAPQLYRSLAFAYAWTNQTKKMKHVLRKMKGINAQLLMGFITKKRNPAGVSPRGVHPALEQEAFQMVMKSGAVPRKMQIKRM
jgi:hypothetical protein